MIKDTRLRYEVDPDKLAHAAREEDILYLVRCGVRYSDDCLGMFT
jgi:hypothetical protein